MSKLKPIFYAAGIGLSYLYYGFLQEKIIRTKHGPEGEMFTCTTTLVLLQCVSNALFAKFILMFIIKQGIDRTRSTYYAMCSFTYLLAMISSNMALQHVNYPTQVVGKSCKPIPVMLLGVLFGRKKYSLRKYFFVFLIVSGVALFMYKKKQSAPAVGSATDLSIIGIGELLLLLSLSMDGLTGAIQERMKSEYQTKSVHMMFSMNFWSVIYTLALTLGSGEIFRFYEFVSRHQSLMLDIILFSSLSAIGQLFIFFTVADLGPLTCSIITTTRKFFTVSISVILFGHKLSAFQWTGSCLVFLGLALDAIFKEKTMTTPTTSTKQKSN